MVILLNLMCLVLQLLLSVKENTKHVDITKISVFFSWGFPALLMAVAYNIDSQFDNTLSQLDELYWLNLARHGFSCSMRFKNSVQEWLLLWVHLSWL